MRLFSVFFACYLALLACLPCVDREPVRSDGTQTFVSATPHEAGTHLAGDWCTPLCQCHCCAGTSLPTALRIVLIAPPKAFYAAGRYAWLPAPAARQMPGSIWQPPQA
jgi:hypothetical protein